MEKGGRRHRKSCKSNCSLAEGTNEKKRGGSGAEYTCSAKASSGGEALVGGYSLAQVLRKANPKQPRPHSAENARAVKV